MDKRLENLYKGIGEEGAGLLIEDFIKRKDTVDLPFARSLTNIKSCCQNLAKIIRDWDKSIRQHVKFENGVAIVDWEALAPMHPLGEDVPADDLYIGTMRYLIELGVLSLETKGNYGVYAFDNILLINPTIGTQSLYFTRQNDAQEFKENSPWPTVSEIIKL